MTAWLLEWLLFLAGMALLICIADRFWLRHAADPDLPLYDPEGYLELTARMTELCHDDRDEVARRIDDARQAYPEATHAQVVRLAMQRLLAPEAEQAAGQ